MHLDCGISVPDPTTTAGNECSTPPPIIARFPRYFESGPARCPTELVRTPCHTKGQRIQRMRHQFIHQNRGSHFPSVAIFRRRLSSSLIDGSGHYSAWFMVTAPGVPRNPNRRRTVLVPHWHRSWGRTFHGLQPEPTSHRLRKAS